MTDEEKRDKILKAKSGEIELECNLVEDLGMRLPKPHSKHKRRFGIFDNDLPHRPNFSKEYYGYGKN
jgi:hypothetical protein